MNKLQRNHIKFTEYDTKKASKPDPEITVNQIISKWIQMMCQLSWVVQRNLPMMGLFENNIQNTLNTVKKFIWLLTKCALEVIY